MAPLLAAPCDRQTPHQSCGIAVQPPRDAFSIEPSALLNLPHGESRRFSFLHRWPCCGCGGAEHCNMSTDRRRSTVIAAAAHERTARIHSSPVSRRVRLCATHFALQGLLPLMSSCCTIPLFRSSAPVQSGGI